MFHTCNTRVQPTYVQIQIQNTNNFILHRIKNNDTLATIYFSMLNLYNVMHYLQ